MTIKKTALVLGAGGFIGNHLVNRLKSEGYWVRGVDIKIPDFTQSQADDFIVMDLRNAVNVNEVISHAGCIKGTYQSFAMRFNKQFDEIYQLAADMGGAGYIFTKEHDADIMHNSATINLNVLNAIIHHIDKNLPKIFYSSSACMYPEHNQLDSKNPNCIENSAYPANPDSEYGWEKLFSERLYLAYARNYKLNVRIARFHNIYGPLGTWKGGKEKAPAAICRKVLTAVNGEIEIWGDGLQTRSFLYIDECIEGIRRLMNSQFIGPVNLGSKEMVTINQLVDVACSIDYIQLNKKYINGPLGVRGRNSDNRLIKEKIGWEPNYPLHTGIKQTYMWIKEQLTK